MLGVAGTAALAAACGGAYGSSGGGSATPQSARAVAAGHTTIGMTPTSIGSVLTGPTGHTLYVLVNSRGNPLPCTGGCLTVWPPLTISSGAPEDSSGVTAPVSTTASSGTMQVTIGGDPVYYYASDRAAGQANGEGIRASGGTWYALQPGGQPLKPGSGSGSSSSNSTSSTNPYGY